MAPKRENDIGLQKVVSLSPALQPTTYGRCPLHPCFPGQTPYPNNNLGLCGGNQCSGCQYCSSGIYQTVCNTCASITSYIWLFSGDTLISVDWSISSDPYGVGGTIYASGTWTGVSSYLLTNSQGYDIHSFVIQGVHVRNSAGLSYWFTLQNAVTANSNAAYWDVNAGPALAEQKNFIFDDDQGVIDSENFIIQTGTCVSYTNGPSSLDNYGRTINYGYAVTDQFTVSLTCPF